jgi:hypothetical protein
LVKKILQHKYLNPLIKFLITTLLIWTIYEQVFAKENIADIWQTFVDHFEFPNLNWLLAVLFLVPFNWGFETLKWRELIKSFSNISFWRTYRAILAGVTVSLFTPNRIGEYGGRILMVEPENNWKAVVATLVGSMSQLMVLLTFGLIGAVYFSAHFLNPEAYILKSVFVLGIIFIIILLTCFFNIDLLIPLIKRLPYAEKLKKYVKHVQVLRNYSSNILASVLFYSFLRYLTYTTQYFLILQFFGIDVPIFAAFAGIATIFLLQTSVPLPPIMGLLARGEFALFIWGFFSTNEIDVLAATFSLFVINLTFPALLGLVFIVQTNVVESLGGRR